MPQTRRERLLAFVISVVLCCMMSGSLSLIARRGRETSSVSTGTARLATPHNDVSTPLSDESHTISEVSGFFSESHDALSPLSNTSNNVTPGTSDVRQDVIRALRAAQGGLGENMVAGAILCLVAAMCCAITAVGALLMIRGPQRSAEYYSPKSVDATRDAMKKKTFGAKNISETRPQAEGSEGIGRDELDEMSPEEAV